MAVTIKRTEAPELRGFARNGNLATQAMTYRWLVFAGGELVGSYLRLRDAKLLAAEFGCTRAKVER